jgi:hypothetical protein
MKKFLISEEEKNRILNLHENMKTVDKERQLELSGKKLNENVSPIIRALIDNASSAGRISSRVMDALDNIAVRRQLLSNYGNTIQNGDDLLDAFIAGRLSNTHADDDAVRVFKKIFTSTDDDELIEQLAKEMVEGDAAFKRGLMDGRYDPNQIYPGKQGAAIENYVNTLKSNQGNINPLVRNFDDPENIVGMLRAKYKGNKPINDALDKAAAEIRLYRPKSQKEADEILLTRSREIDALLEQQKLTPGMIADYKKELQTGWAAQKFKKFIGLMFYVFLFEVLMTSFGFTAFTPLQSLARSLGVMDAFEAARKLACERGVKAACDFGGGGGDAPPPGFGDMN